MDRHGVERVRMTATSAARDADNREDFFAAAEAAVGVRARAADRGGGGPALLRRGHRRARPRRRPVPRRATSGAAPPSSSSAPSECEAAMSIDIGCVRLTEKYLLPRPAAARGALDRHLGRPDLARRRRPRACRRRWRRRPSSASRARSRTVAAVEIGLAEYDRDAHPPLRAVARGGRGRLPHAGDRDAGRPAAQPRAGGGAGRRDRRRLLRPGGSCAASAAPSAWCRRPTSSTVWWRRRIR